MNVQTILSVKGTEVATIAPSATLAEAADMLADRGYGALIASVDGASLDGIISERDVVRALSADRAAALEATVSSAMSANVFTCEPGDSIDSLMSMMTEKRIRHLPVREENGALGGMISIGDVVKYRLIELERENHQLHDYIQGNVS